MQNPDDANEAEQQPQVRNRTIGPLAYAFEMSLGVAALAVGAFFEFSPLDQLHLNWPGVAKDVVSGIAATIPLVAGLYLIHRFPAGPLIDLKMAIESVVVPMFRGVTVVEFALISAAAGFGEELLFRGLLQAGLTEWGGDHGTWIGLTVASVVFGLLHWLNATYAVVAGFIGLYLGLVFIVSGNLLSPMIAHGLYDFVALLFLVKRQASD